VAKNWTPALICSASALCSMATGRQAFYGTSTAVIYEAILNRAPMPITGVNPQLPPKLEEIVNKAMEKDRDLRADLKRLKRDTSSGRSAVAALSEPVSTPEQGSGGTGTSPAVPRSRRWPLWLAGLLVVIVAGLPRSKT
jgi:hypothetical protein